jgi:hypothetical protein
VEAHRTEVRAIREYIGAYPKVLANYFHWRSGLWLFWTRQSTVEGLKHKGLEENRDNIQQRIRKFNI